MTMSNNPNFDDGLSCDEKLTGWLPLRGPQDVLIVYIMNNIYNESASDRDPIFDMPDQLSHAKIYWTNGSAAAFYTAKPKGKFCHHTHQVCVADDKLRDYVFTGLGRALSAV